MKRGPSPQLPSTKIERGTYRPHRDKDKIEVVCPMTDNPQMPEWLTPEGEVVWINTIMLTTPRVAAGDTNTFGFYCNIIGAIGKAFMSGSVPPTSAITEARKLGELFGLSGAQSRVLVKSPAQIEVNPFNKFKSLRRDVETP